MCLLLGQYQQEAKPDRKSEMNKEKQVQIQEKFLIETKPPFRRIVTFLNPKEFKRNHLLININVLNSADSSEISIFEIMEIPGYIKLMLKTQTDLKAKIFKKN